MKPALLLLVIATLSSHRTRAAAAESDDGRPVDSRITEVTVYADRAQVLRSGWVELAAGVSRFAFAKLPGWIDEGSLRVSLAPVEAGQILDVQVHRTYLARGTDEEFQKAELAVREIADQIAALDDEKAVLEAQAKQVESIRVFATEKLPKDAAVRKVKTGEFEQAVEFTGGSLRKLATARRALEKQRRDLQPELEARQRKLEELRQRAQLEQRTVVATVKSGGARPAQLQLSYLVPGATWEPVHELRASLDGKPVALASQAVVMQSTGEDWLEVKLSLSTQRSTATMKIPELEAFLVGSGQKLPRFVAGGERDTFDAAKRSYLSQSAQAYTLRFGGKGAAEFGLNVAEQFDNTRRMEVVFQQLQQRGTTAHFPAAGAQIVRSDARPVRVAIGQAELAAQHRIIAAPEASLNAARTVELTNTSRQPLLPGRVALYMEGAFLGLTETDFVAPGESFPLFLGVADQIKLTRTLDKKKSELTRGGSRTKMKASFLVTVENLTDRQTFLQLNDRVPVSESEDIRVTGVKPVPEIKADAKGLLHWDVTLMPRQAREFRVEYVLDYPNDLSYRSAAPAVGGGGGGGGGWGKRPEKGVTNIPGRSGAGQPEVEAKPEPQAASRSLPEQIQSLEKRF